MPLVPAAVVSVPVTLACVCGVAAARAAQGILNEHLGTLFKIKTGFHGDILSNVAKVCCWCLHRVAAPIWA